MSARRDGAPSAPVPSGSVVRSMSTRPASANATTSGGEARYDARTRGWIRPSKLRLPDSTAATTSSFGLDRLRDRLVERAELPMHVVQP